MSQTDNAIHPDDFRRLEGEVTDMKQLMGQMTHALTRLALLEERHQGVSATANKILDQVEQIRTAQHGTDLKFAAFGDLMGRVGRLEDKAREDHLQYQKDRSALDASMRTMKWVLGGGWTLFVFGFGIYLKFAGGA